MIRILLYTAVAVLILSFFGISIQSVVDSPAGQQNIAYVAGLISDLFWTALAFIADFFRSIVQWIAGLFAW